jgi:hypothetical protein
MNPKYPIYIPSKGRYERLQTARCLMDMGVPFRVVVEPQERQQYERELGIDRVLTLPFSNLGQGSIPARNWIWNHAASNGHERHWCIDDNIAKFYRLNFNRRIPVTTGAIFRCIEDFSDRYENVAMSGMNYCGFAKDRIPTLPPFILNTRIYSMILLNTSLTHRWRGRYNEDTDLSLRVLKDGWCTVQFNAFLGAKGATMTQKGGNTDEVYGRNSDDYDHRRRFAESLRDQHPDVVRVSWKFQRWHHQVDYSPFRKNKLRLKPGITPTGADNEYGMRLIKVASSRKDGDNGEDETRDDS